MNTWKSSSLKETSAVAEEVLAILESAKKAGAPLVVGLKGELGSGKTTFTKALAKKLKVKEQVSSPTFVLMRRYATKNKKLKTLYHFDCYRLDGTKELKQLYWDEILKDKGALVLLEWADLVRRALPKETMWLEFSHGDGEKERVIKMKS